MGGFTLFLKFLFVRIRIALLRIPAFGFIHALLLLILFSFSLDLFFRIGIALSWGPVFGLFNALLTARLFFFSLRLFCRKIGGLILLQSLEALPRRFRSESGG